MDRWTDTVIAKSAPGLTSTRGTNALRVNWLLSSLPVFFLSIKYKSHHSSKMSAYFAFFPLFNGLAFRALHLTHSFHGNYTQCWRWCPLAVSESKVLEKKLLKCNHKTIKREKVHLPSHINTTRCGLTCFSPFPPLLFSLLWGDVAWTLDVHPVL